MQKKLISILILTVIFFLQACGTSDTITNEEENIKTEELKDFNGAEFILATQWVNEYRPDEGFSAVGDNMRRRYEDINTNYNCNLQVVLVEGVPSAYVMNSIASGSNIPDILDVHAADVYSLYKQDVLFPYDEVTTIDLTDPKWGPKTFIRYGLFNGKQYGTFPYDWEFIPAIGGVLLFNNDMYKAMGYTKSPYEMKEAGEWTWDNFKKILEECTYTEGDKSYYGLGIEETFKFMLTAVFSNSGEVVTEKDGKPTFGLLDKNAVDALTYAQSLKPFSKEVTHPNFVNGECAFFFVESWKGTHMSEGIKAQLTPVYTMNDYGMMPFPVGPAASDPNETSAFVHLWRRLNWLIGPSDNDKDDVGYVMDKLFEPIANTNKAAWKDLLNKSVFHHPEQDLENFVHMVENVKYDYSVELSKSGSTLQSRLVSIYKGKSVVEEMSKIEEVLNNDIATEIVGVTAAPVVN